MGCGRHTIACVSLFGRTEEECMVTYVDAVRWAKLGNTLKGEALGGKGEKRTEGRVKHLNTGLRSERADICPCNDRTNERARRGDRRRHRDEAGPETGRATGWGVEWSVAMRENSGVMW